jgi:hypothetical protein
MKQLEHRKREHGYPPIPRTDATHVHQSTVQYRRSEVVEAYRIVPKTDLDTSPPSQMPFLVRYCRIVLDSRPMRFIFSTFDRYRKGRLHGPPTVDLFGSDSGIIVAG